MEVQVLLFEEQAQEEPVEAGEQVPVEKAQIVADDVVAEVHKLNALPAALAAALALQAAEKDLPRRQLELFELGEEAGVEQGLWLRVGHGWP